MTTMIEIYANSESSDMLCDESSANWQNDWRTPVLGGNHLGATPVRQDLK